MFMKVALNKDTAFTLLVILLIAVFGIFYGQLIINLPLFGDATIHGANAKDLLKGGWAALNADYPSLYSYVMAELFVFFGEKGFNLVPLAGLIFLLISTYLYVRSFSNKYLALVAMIFVGVSPKVIYYSARMYQEILLSALIIFSIYLLFKFLEDQKKIFLLLFFTGITLSIKQQGLFILYSSFVAFFVIGYFRKKIKLSSVILMIFIPLIIGLGFYGVLFHNTGILMPGSEEFAPLKIINKAGQVIFRYKGPEISNNIFSFPTAFAESGSVNNTLESDLSKVESVYSVRAYSRAESRHIWPTEIFTNIDKFNQANNLFLLTWSGIRLDSPILYYLSFAFIILGIIYAILNYKGYTDLLIFTLIFLSINYFLFIRNNDQQRYHMFIPIYLLPFIFMFANYILKRIEINRYIMLIVIVAFSTLTFYPVLTKNVIQNEWWSNSQLYSPSTGGIKSVSEVGSWISNNSSSSTIVGQQCGNEMHYYSNRTVVGDWRIYFLPPRDIKSYINKNRIQYYVINDSQLVKDADWHHICWVPDSFYTFMRNNYPVVYTSSVNDIYVFKTL